MSQGEIFNKALCKLCLTADEVSDYRPASGLFMSEINGYIPNAIIIWLKTGEKIIYINK